MRNDSSGAAIGPQYSNQSTFAHLLVHPPRLSEAQAEASQATTELQLRSPRPRPPSRPPWDLLDEDTQNMCVRALREGCPPEDMHRLLIGVSGQGHQG